MIRNLLNIIQIIKMTKCYPKPQYLSMYQRHNNKISQCIMVSRNVIIIMVHGAWEHIDSFDNQQKQL